MRIFGLLAALVIFLAPLSAQANVINGTTSSRVSVPAKGAASVNVTWRMTWDDVLGAGSATITSNNAFVIVDGATIATIGNTLSQFVATNGQAVTFSETLTLSPAIARRISQAPAGSAVIRRTFSDGGAISATINAPVSTGNIGPLSVRRIELKFENQSRTDIVQKGDTLRAVADISFRSNGLLRGEWRIVDASASLGSARGRVIQKVRQQLVSSGEGRQRIVSPPLPTKTNGLHMVSFSVEDTDGNITVPILRYFVLEGRDNVPPINLSVLTPGNGATLNKETAFSWNAMAGAHAYQVEILPQGSDNPVTAKLVPGTDLKLSLSSLSFEDLAPASLYDWRVQALANGKIIGQSERYSLKTQ
ncbi:MAG: hypothetical protein KTR28_00305 [Micavibrio sp.]|nr:hypothetical protein [Micavibrio sp.]